MTFWDRETSLGEVSFQIENFNEQNSSRILPIELVLCTVAVLLKRHTSEFSIIRTPEIASSQFRMDMFTKLLVNDFRNILKSQQQPQPNPDHRF